MEPNHRPTSICNHEDREPEQESLAALSHLIHRSEPHLTADSKTLLQKDPRTSQLGRQIRTDFRI